MERDGMIRPDDYHGKDQISARRYMPGLDGLRALAVLAVIAYHLNLPWAPGGLLGVCIFFVLSGYLITDILAVQWKSDGGLNLKSFWLGRARRLLPALFVMLTGVIVWLSLYNPVRLSSLWNDILAAVFYSSNWWLIFHKVSYFASFGPPSPLNHLWSLAVEEQFYLVWPLLLGLGLCYIPHRGRLIGLITALIITSAAAMAIIYKPGLDPSRVYYGTDTRAFALLIGAVLALMWPSRKLSADLSSQKRIILDAIGGAALLAVLFMIGQSNQYQTFLYYGGLLLFSLVSAVLVAVLAHPASWLGRLFGRLPLRWLGVLSYGIYLWHYPVIVLTSPGVNTRGLNIVLALEQMALTISLAAISWYFIENPIRHGKWKKHFKSLSNGLKRRPRLLGFRGRATLASIILSLFIFLLAASGCAMISNAQQRSLPSEVVSETEPTTMPAQPESQGTKENETEKQTVETINRGADQNSVFTGKGVTAIGDSVMVEVGPELKKLFPDIIVDGKIGRQMYQAPQVIKNLEDQGMLGKMVIIELGANGAFTEKQFTDILNLLGNDRRIIIVNTRVPKPWENVVNQILAQTAATNPNIEMVNWYSASSGHNEYFYPDGVHLKEAGVKAYVALVADAVNP